MNKGWITIIFFLSSMQAFGQVVTDWEIRANNFYNRIKNIEFFMDRFNHGRKELMHLSKIDTATYIKKLKERDILIFTLFDKQRLKSEGDKYISKKNAQDFIRQVNNPYQPQFLNFSDSGWYATFAFEGEYKKKPIAIDCALKVNRDLQGVYTWTIIKIFSKDLKLDDHFENQLNFNPSVHGTDFMGVRISLSDPEWIKEARESNKLLTSRFLDLLITKDLRLIQIHKITYHFLKIDNWIFSVKYVNRESANSGWLVDELLSSSTENKNNYLNSNGIK